MKKILSKGILIGTLFTFCLSLGSISTLANTVNTIESEYEETKGGEAEWQTTFVTDEKRFVDYFPDKNLATAVASRFRRSNTDAVTQEELLTINYLYADAAAISDISGIGFLTNFRTIKSK